MPRILIIDDDAFFTAIYKRKFEVEGFEVVTSTGGEDGIRLAADKKPDVILLDLVMPRVDGFQTLEKLKADAVTRSIPVYVFTNLGQQSDIDRCLSLGAAGYAIKAQTLPEEAVKQVKQLLGMP
ncbi:MAG TPA: response regulator [Candidatus Methylomirabilis sp.]|nr:response regulator [Candidatus Methylomirabilis sp.]